MSLASSYIISGTGFAIANTILLSAIVLSASQLKTPGAEHPIKTSAPQIASSKVPCLLSGFTLAKSSHCTRSRFPLSYKIPFELSTVIFFGLAPASRIRRAIAVPAAPAPFTTIFTSSNFFSATLSAPKSAANAAIAVPC